MILSYLVWRDNRGGSPLCSTMQSLSNDDIALHKDPLIQTETHGGVGTRNTLMGLLEDPPMTEVLKS